MSLPAWSVARVAGLVALMVAPFAVAQSTLEGRVATPDLGPVDVVAEARAGLAWFPYELGRGRLGSDGGFELHFRPGTLPQEVTHALDGLFDAPRCAGMVVSEPAARAVVVRELRVIPEGAACEYCETIGTIYAATRQRDALASTGDVEVQWIYVDRDVTVEGRCSYGWGDETYALHLSQGWNVVVVETTAVLATEGYCDCREVTLAVAPVPEGIVWHFIPQR
jgi:hypothetical protein